MKWVASGSCWPTIFLGISGDQVLDLVSNPGKNQRTVTILPGSFRTTADGRSKQTASQSDGGPFLQMLYAPPLYLHFGL